MLAYRTSARTDRSARKPESRALTTIFCGIPAASTKKDRTSLCPRRKGRAIDSGDNASFHAIIVERRSHGGRPVRDAPRPASRPASRFSKRQRAAFSKFCFDRGVVDIRALVLQRLPHSRPEPCVVSLAVSQELHR